MASSKEFKDFIIDQLSALNGITYRPMMGEFLLYYNGILFGVIYDNRLLIKPTKTNTKYNLQQQVPYSSTKPMLMLENLDDKTYLETLIKDTCIGLTAK